MKEWKYKHIYQCDSDWFDGMIDVEEWLNISSRDDALPESERTEIYTNARLAAEDYLSEEPFIRKVAGLPADADFNTAPYIFFIFKETNNGNTILVSPVSIPWLERVNS